MGGPPALLRPALLRPAASIAETAMSSPCRRRVGAGGQGGQSVGGGRGWACAGMDPDILMGEGEVERGQRRGPHEHHPPLSATPGTSQSCHCPRCTGVGPRRVAGHLYNVDRQCLGPPPAARRQPQIILGPALTPLSAWPTGGGGGGGRDGRIGRRLAAGVEHPGRGRVPGLLVLHTRSGAIGGLTIRWGCCPLREREREREWPPPANYLRSREDEACRKHGAP